MKMDTFKLYKQLEKFPFGKNIFTTLVCFKAPYFRSIKPKILLMDEPFAALDEQTRLLLGDKVLQIQQELKQTTLLITHNITEAVQMSDRILVMTYRPGKVKRIVEINLPRPRTSEIVGSEAFGRYVAQIWNDLREEANRGMRDEEKNVLRQEEQAL